MSDRRLWLMDRSRLSRTGLKMLLAGAFHIADEMPAIPDLEKIETPFPDVVLATTDVLMDQGQFTGITQIQARAPLLPVVVLTPEMSFGELVAAMKAGARGYLGLNVSKEALIQSLNLVISGEKVFPSELVESLFDSSRLRASAPGGVGGIAFTESQFKIVRGLALGQPYKVIALEVGLTESAVKGLVKAIMRKIGVSNRTEAGLWAVKHGY